MSSPSLYATCALGTEDLVAREIRALGFRARRERGGVRFDVPPGGELEAGMRACLHLRAAMRVLWPLATYPAGDAAALYEGAAAVSWEDWLTPRHTFSVLSTTRAAPPLAHAPFIGQKVKDAIADRLRARCGARPDVSRDSPDVRVYVHVAPFDGRRASAGNVTIGLDLSGESLHRRGYRLARSAAPLRETLAAAVLLATGWDGTCPLVDPMCGSGTIPIEAALYACGVAPGRAVPGGRRFGFETWPRFGDAERAVFRRLCEEADASVRPRAPAPIVGADRDSEAIAAARANAARAVPSVAASVEWRVADVRSLSPLDLPQSPGATGPAGVIVSNPPYGERLGGGPGLEVFFRQLGQRLRAFSGYTAFLLVGGKDMARALAMRPTWERRFWNGPLPVTLCRYELGRRGAKSAEVTGRSFPGSGDPSDPTAA